MLQCSNENCCVYTGSEKQSFETNVKVDENRIPLEPIAEAEVELFACVHCGQEGEKKDDNE